MMLFDSYYRTVKPISYIKSVSYLFHCSFCVTVCISDFRQRLSTVALCRFSS